MLLPCLTPLLLSDFFPFLLDVSCTPTILEHMFVVKCDMEEANGHEAALARFCAQFDPTTVPLEQAAALYETLARMEKLVAGARLRLAARVEQSTAPRLTGSPARRVSPQASPRPSSPPLAAWLR